jgi:hypothetical protein
MRQPDQEPEPRSGFRTTLSNWTDYDAPFGVKLREAVSNTWIKVRNRQGCCGHHGHPGC